MCCRGKSKIHLQYSLSWKGKSSISRHHHLLQRLDIDYACSDLISLLCPPFWVLFSFASTVYCQAFLACYQLSIRLNGLPVWGDIPLIFHLFKIDSASYWYHNSLITPNDYPAIERNNFISARCTIFLMSRPHYHMTY